MIQTYIMEETNYKNSKAGYAYGKCDSCNKHFKRRVSEIRTIKNFCCSDRCKQVYKFRNNKKKRPVTITTPDGRKMFVHRYAMELYLGRKLNKNEVVHHINENKFDNSIKNLKVMLSSKHLSYHRQKWWDEGNRLPKNQKNQYSEGFISKGVWK